MKLMPIEEKSLAQVHIPLTEEPGAEFRFPDPSFLFEKSRLLSSSGGCQSLLLSFMCILTEHVCV